MPRPKKQITPVEAPIEELKTPIVVAPIITPSIVKTTYNHIGVEYELYKLDDFIHDPRLGHLDWAEPDLENLDYNGLPFVQPFGKLISIFIYRPFLEMSGGLYDSKLDASIGTAESMLDHRPVYGRFEKRVFGNVNIKLAPVPKRESYQNPMTGKTSSRWVYTDKDIIIDNEFSNVISTTNSQVYNSNVTQTLTNGVNQFKESFLPPKISNEEAQAILTGRYINAFSTPHNITSCTLTKEAIRRSSEYQNGNIKEYIMMTLGDEVVYDTFLKEKRTILAKDNITPVNVTYLDNFSWTPGNTLEALENNKGYLIITDAVIKSRKSYLSQVHTNAVINTVETQYGADDETIRRALAAYNSTK